eukprot:CAMPEP_0184870616 /NCGR_PEP_ID=MMETSP0580-20130426/38154_1 /TAXON_ID=1118495 /ORGANISM="Dactyliosolen fragilissimus" /LENGTH=149 /DNA_ID=CAMNT_0027372793 /DNA_START=172 /DNA_END=618 /DNA_ORIENTATION=+
MRGARVSHVKETTIINSSNGDVHNHHHHDICMEVHLRGGTILYGTHVVGADGIGSPVRQSILSSPKQQPARQQGNIVTCPNFSIHMNCNHLPNGWKTDGTYVVKPKDTTTNFYSYILLSPRPDRKGLSITMVCDEEKISKEIDWLVVPP